MIWKPRSAEPAAVARLAQEANLSPTLARLLVARGIGDPESALRFLHPSLDHLHSPYALLGMKAAVERLRAAIERQERVLIYGDYDVDGTTAVVILKTAIELCGGTAEFHVPHRIKEGYGIQSDVIEQAAAAGIRLVISVDTGIRAFAAADTAHRLGLDLIVTDHHLPESGGVPRALAVLNPNQAGCDYPCKSLCGAGVAFKIAQALVENLGRPNLVPSFLKIVAIATIADAVPLVGENRVFAALGLDGLRRPVNLGLKALFQAASLSGGRALTAGDVAFRIAPRLNAAGRMDVATDVVDLFSTRDADEAGRIAARLNQLNTDRQQEELRIVEAIDELLSASPELRDGYCLVLDGDGWHRGVVGIAATRVVEKYCRPALVIARSGDEAHGSGRSIPAFHLLEALESCAPLFTRFGGHAHAVGFALPCEKIADLRRALDSFARARLTTADFEPVLRHDGVLALSDVTPELFAALEQMEPFGMGNPEPVFAATGVRLLQPPKIMKEKHVRLRLGQNGAGRAWQRGTDAIGWRMAETVQEQSILAGDVLDVAFTLEHNDHPDFGGLELRLRDVRKNSALATTTAS